MPPLEPVAATTPPVPPIEPPETAQAAPPPSDGVPAGPGRTMLAFTAAYGWTRVPSPLPPDDGGRGYADLLDDAGFTSTMDFGVEGASTLSLQVYEHRDKPRFIATLSTFGCYEAVLLDGWPDLLGFLREHLPTIETALRLDDLADRRDRAEQLAARRPRAAG